MMPDSPPINWRTWFSRALNHPCKSGATELSSAGLAVRRSLESQFRLPWRPRNVLNWLQGAS